MRAVVVAAAIVTAVAAAVFYMTAIVGELGAMSRVEAALIAFKAGLVEQDARRDEAQ